MSAAVAPIFELWNYCPHLSCGERIDSSAATRFCGQCGENFDVCPTCRATNRLLAGFCRGCGKRLENEVWPLYPGLRAHRPAQGSIQALGEIQPPYPVHLGAEVLVSPIAADGLVILTQNDGRIVLLGEMSGEIIGRLTFSQPIEVTPALHAGSLFVATGARLSAVDLIEYLDRPLKQETRPIWEVQFDEGAITQPLLVDAHSVFACVRRGDQAMVVAVSQATGQSLWTEPFRLDSYQTGPLVLAAGSLIAITLSGQVSVIDQTTGQLRHSLSLGRSLDPQVSLYALEDRVLWADMEGTVSELVIRERGSSVNKLYVHRARLASLAASNEFIALGHMAGLTLLDPYGQMLWSNDSIESVSETPIIAGRSVFALDDTGNGLLFDVLRSNPTLRRKLLNGWVGAPPLITHSKITCVSGDGKVVSIDWR